MGFTVEQMVHDYRDICQAVTELAMEQELAITTEEFHTLNRCLDNAIASAVTEYARARDVSTSGNEVERLGFFAHELRNLLASATLTFQMLRRGSVGISGSTGDLHDRTLRSLGDLIDGTLPEVRLTAHVLTEELVRVAEIVEDVAVTATENARARGLGLTVRPARYDAFVSGDRQLLAAAVANLAQNAVKFTRAAGEVSISTTIAGGRVLIDVADECGGLPPLLAQSLAKPFQQAGTDRSGLGLGLAIVQKSVTANHGVLRMQDRPGQGCTFTIDLPESAPNPASV